MKNFYKHESERVVLKLYEVAGKSGSKIGKFLYAQAYFQGKIPNISLKDAVAIGRSMIKELADEGFPEAQYR